ncbi:hypothetical protein BV22DRAFT_1042062 [Leucogyrophana mollusca]|uniref:Uncharacterized protein n=1 Tax=Leucogyrophana mollusca TaxID=85980 RepID=A0ACB8AYQ2_9AGAM|nr:hypothetical protein BV22DRAFT_1042062 [Leucogyrophana mollusca]
MSYTGSAVPSTHSAVPSTYSTSSSTSSITRSKAELWKEVKMLTPPASSQSFTPRPSYPFLPPPARPFRDVSDGARGRAGEPSLALLVLSSLRLPGILGV